MAFPEDRMPHRLRAAFGSDAASDPSTWSWTDITAAINDQQITITRGQPNEGGEPEPTSISLVLDNQSGDYTPDNPLSAYYPGVDLGVPLEYSVEGVVPYLALDGSAASVSTPDTAQVDITGSIDIRGELALDNWSPTTPVDLAAKYQPAGDQRSWIVLYNTNRRMVLGWSADGIAVSQYSPTATVTVPASERIAWRVTLNTANSQVTFYTAPSIAGPWTQLGDASAPGAATSIFNSSAPVTVGGSDVGFAPVRGAYYAFQLYDGINGTLVADPDFTAQTPGDTEFTDDTGLTWTLNGAAEITLWQYRFQGNATSWAPVWPYGDLSTEDGQGVVVYEGESQVTLTASGVLQRLGQGDDALDSTLYRRIPSFGPLAYWTLEDGAAATQGASPIDGVSPLRLTHVNWASADSLPSSRPLPVLASSSAGLPAMRGAVPAPSTTLTEWSVYWIYRLDTANTTLRTFMRVLAGGGTVAEWYIQTRDNLSRIIGLDSDGNTVFSQDIGTSDDLYGQWMLVRLEAIQDGGNVDWAITWRDVGGDAGQFASTFAGTIGRPTAVTSPPDGYSSDLDGMALGHISVWPSNSTAAYNGAIDAWAGESAGERMIRLCQEEGVPFTIVGDTADTELMGPQRVATLLALLTECAATDQGLFGEQRSARGLRYRTRTSLYNQTPALVLDAGNNEITNPLAPVRDDQRIRNAVTVSRQDGSSATATDEASIARHGRYNDPVTINAASDDQLEPLAFWRLHLGTWPGMRYPAVSSELSIAPQKIGDWLTVDYGDRLQVLDLPRPQHPTTTVDLLLQGYSETISPTKWTVTGNCRPAGPYTVAVVDDSSNGIIGTKADSGVSELAAPVAADDTQLSVAVTSGLVWVTDPAQMPIGILAGGEEMTVTAITGTSSPQLFTVTRSVNRVSKPHEAGTAVRLAQPGRVAL